MHAAFVTNAPYSSPGLNVSLIIYGSVVIGSELIM